MALENNLLGSLAHLDSTSMSVEGKYEQESQENVIKLTYGHSKDHWPDLKQAVTSQDNLNLLSQNILGAAGILSISPGGSNN